MLKIKGMNHVANVIKISTLNWVFILYKFAYPKINSKKVLIIRTIRSTMQLLEGNSHDVSRARKAVNL